MGTMQHRANASQTAILVTAWVVGMGIWAAGLASLAVFF